MFSADQAVSFKSSEAMTPLTGASIAVEVIALDIGVVAVVRAVEHRRTAERGRLCRGARCLWAGTRAGSPGGDAGRSFGHEGSRKRVVRVEGR